jgi:hypothetical protein
LDPLPQFKVTNRDLEQSASRKIPEKMVSNCKFQEMVLGIVYVKGRSSLARQHREKIARRMRGAGRRRKGRKTTAPS